MRSYPLVGSPIYPSLVVAGIRQREARGATAEGACSHVVFRTQGGERGGGQRSRYRHVHAAVSHLRGWIGSKLPDRRRGRMGGRTAGHRNNGRVAVEV